MEQLTLSFEPGISRRYENLLECVTTCVYRTGHGKVAGKVDLAPSNLTIALAGNTNRHFGVDHLEKYLDAFHDMEPIYYLIDKYLAGKSATKEQLMSEANKAIADLRAVLQRLKD